MSKPLKLHYLNNDHEKPQTTPCGIVCFPCDVSGEADTEINNRILYSNNMDRVTCGRCLKSWNKFARINRI
jgi:hypothetical protein